MERTSPQAKNFKETRLNDWVSFSLKVGIAISGILIVIGLVLVSIVGTKETEAVAPPNKLLEEILAFNATAIITLGVLTLLLTPILQVILAIVNFSRDGDKRFLAISVALMFVLVLSLVLTLI